MFYRYDAWGNLISRRNGIYEQHYRYDADNRLIQARGRGPQGEFDAQYHYDALGRRTRKTVSYKGKAAQTTRFVWQGYRLLQEQRADGSRRSWSYDPASPWSPLAALEQAGDSRSAEIYWYHTDLNSAPLEVTDAAGNLRWSGNYDTFGKLQGQTVEGAARRNGAQYDQPLRYAGQYQDDESGLHYNLFRYYEPEVGRFTTQDPIGLHGGLNLYQYAPNPLGWVDPLGLSPCSSGTSLTVNKPKILSNSNLTNAERSYLERQFTKKQNALNRAAQRGELVWSPGTHDVRISSVQSSYRQAVAARYERMFGQAPDLTKLNADHPVDLIVGGSPTQRLQMLNESINKSVGSSLKNAGRKAGLQPGDRISEIIFQ
ncbi:Cell wall-associated polypeptide CWBP200 [Serratia ficaria]|nr:Cell wall-associated polypeptide CWBP200 [Serratia ficaria]